MDVSIAVRSFAEEAVITWGREDFTDIKVFTLHHQNLFTKLFLNFLHQKGLTSTSGAENSNDSIRFQ